MSAERDEIRPGTIAAVRFADDPGGWESIGFAVRRVDGDARIDLEGADLVLAPSGASTALVVSGIEPAGIDGIEVIEASATGPGASRAAHPNTATSLDHVVIASNSLERTSAAIEAALGAPLKRVREAGPVRQGFHRVGGVIVEIVESAAHPGDRAVIWGVAVNVVDLDAAVAAAPDRIRAPRPAVQPGRRIASVRRDAGLTLPVALMTPHPRG